MCVQLQTQLIRFIPETNKKYLLNHTLKTELVQESIFHIRFINKKKTGRMRKEF